MFVIAKVPFQKIYYAERFSLSWWASLFIWVLVILIPFFLANIERYIWRTNLVARKVPYYEFSNSFIITTEGGTNGNEKKIYSTLGGFTSKIPTSQKLYAVDIATYYEPYMENYFPKEETINIKITEPNVKSVEVGFFMYYNFTVSENFVMKFTDFISIPLDVKTGYTTNIYGDFELFQSEVYQDTKVSSTSFTYDAYANFVTYLNLAR